jgi:glutamate racemase
VEIIDPAPAVARQVGRVLAQRGWLSAGDAAARGFYTTGDQARFERALRELLGLGDEARRAVWVAGRLDIPK